MNVLRRRRSLARARGRAVAANELLDAPHRQPLVDDALGDVLVAMAEHDMAAGDAREAVSTLRTAVAYCPSHVPALTSFAQVGVACG